MKIQDIIKKQRIKLEMTQQQIAQKLGVSTPAVNKWESGASYPDITLLPPLARLLKTDLNTLLSFENDLTDDEIQQFIRDVSKNINVVGFEQTFNLCTDKIRQFPTCEKLILNVASVLNFGVAFEQENKQSEYKKSINDMFKQLANSSDSAVKSHAMTFLITNAIEQKDYQQAEFYIEQNDEQPNDIIYLKGLLLKSQQKHQEFFELYENRLLKMGSDMQMIFGVLSDVAFKQQDEELALYYLETLKKINDAFCFYSFNTDIFYFDYYIKKKDKQNALKCMENVLNSLNKRISLSGNRLFSHIEHKQMGEKNPFFDFVISAFEKDVDNQLGFIKDDQQFKELIQKFKQQ